MLYTVRQTPVLVNLKDFILCPMKRLLLQRNICLILASNNVHGMTQETTGAIIYSIIIGSGIIIIISIIYNSKRIRSGKEIILNLYVCAYGTLLCLKLIISRW